MGSSMNCGCKASEIGVALIGVGTVGSGVAEILTKNADIIEMKVGKKVALKAILERDAAKLDALGLSRDLLRTSIDDIINDDSIDIVIELIGGENPAKEFILKSIEHKKNIVTANKELIAKHGEAILEAAKQHGVDVHFEASVGGGIPIIRPLKMCLAGNRIKEIIGIINGTTNYILSKMASDDAEFADVLKEAQDAGYAEADPTADIESYDAMYKLSILASIGFISRVKLDDILREGITGITKKDIKYAKDLGFVIKLLAIARENNGELEVRVHPAMLAKNHPLASVDGVFNAIYVKGDAVGDVMFFGPGAGKLPTGSAVVGDVIEISRNISHGNDNRILCTCFENRTIKPTDSIESAYYVRISCDEKPGVLARIASAYGNHGVSLNAVIQQDTSSSENAEIVCLTNVVTEKNIRGAIDEINKLDVVKSVENVIRVER